MLRAMQRLRQCRLAAAAHAVAHHHDFLDLQHLNREFQRRRHAVMARRGFIGRHHRGDIAHHENLARVDVEDLRRIDPAVAAGDDQHLGALSLAQLFPAFAAGRPARSRKRRYPAIR
jgi:hypothetical protein